MERLWTVVDAGAFGNAEFGRATGRARGARGLSGAGRVRRRDARLLRSARALSGMRAISDSQY